MSRAALAAALLLFASACARNVRPQRPVVAQQPAQRAAQQPEIQSGDLPRDEGDDQIAPLRGALLGEGVASYYGHGFQGKLTANGERFNKEAMTAAHRKLPFGTCLYVENQDNGRGVRVRVNDRGPYAGGRVLDLSEGAARRLAMLDKGVARVKIYAC